MHKFYVWFKHLFVCVCVVCARCMYVQQQRAMHCELKETGWVDLSRQVPTCQSICRQEIALAQTHKYTHCPQYTPNLSPRPPRQLKQYFLLVLLLTLHCFEHCLQFSRKLISSCDVNTLARDQVFNYCHRRSDSRDRVTTLQISLYFLRL